MDQLKAALFVNASGLRTQSRRLQIISQNLANSDATSTVPGGDPYQRKTIHFINVLDRQFGVEIVRTHSIQRDPAPFERRFEPTHPGADEFGYVKYSNVTPLIEITDMQQANRSYQAQLNVFRLIKQSQDRTIDLLR